MVLKVQPSELFLQNVMQAKFKFVSGKVLKEVDGSGTCFAICKRVYNQNLLSYFSKIYLVTNRHNVDYFLLNQKNNDDCYRLFSAIITYRNRESYRDRTLAELVISSSAKILVDDNVDNDVALIECDFEESPNLQNLTWSIPVERLVESFDNCRFDLGDSLSFIGFPGNLWDSKNHLPIVRQASIASCPHLDFTEGGLKDADRILVNGLSLSGSSGSPVFHDRTSEIIGIMSGHFPEGPPLSPDDWEIDGVQSGKPKRLHSGLSYMIKSSVLASQEFFELLT